MTEEFAWASVLSPEPPRAPRALEGTLREHQRGHARPLAVTRSAVNPSVSGAFVVAVTRVPRFRLGAGCKEGVDGSSPSEGLKYLQMSPCVAWLGKAPEVSMEGVT